jgi:serine/threonine protein kinase
MKLLMENWRKYLTEETDATGPMEPWLIKKRKRQEDALKDLEIMGYSIRRELGRGAFGVVYEVENSRTGERSAAKVVSANNKQEVENYKFAMDEKAFMPEKYAKYLPKVKKIITGGDSEDEEDNKGKSTVILMELLEPLDPQTAQELFAAQDTPTASKKPQKILKDPEAVAEIVAKSIEHNRILGQIREFLVDRERIIKVAVNAATKSSHSDVDDLIWTVYSAVIRSLDFQSPAMNKAFEKALKDTILYYFDKQIIPVHQPEEGEDPYDTWTSGGLPKTSALFPEAEGLMDAMKYFMQDQQWKPKDVHIQNVMMRPGTKDFVIVDLGLFKRGIF